MPFLDVNATSGLPPPSNAPVMLPNPFTPMAFLPPDIAVQVTVSTYFFVAITTIQIWDTLTHLVDDYRLVMKNRIQFPMIVYFVWRIATVTFLLGFTIIETAPVQNCTLASRILSVFYLISVPTSELLLFLHVCAVYIDRRPVVYFFVFMWICTLASATTPLITAYIPSSEFRNIGPTKYCTGASLPGFISASAIVPLVNDTLLFLALAWRLHQFSYPVTEGDKRELATVISGRHLPRISRALLQNGQAYFLTTVIINITTVAVVYDGSLPTPYRGMIGYLGIVMMNIMASRIYRNIKSGAFMLGHGTPWPTHRSSGIRVEIQRVDDVPLGQLGSGSNASGKTFINSDEPTRDKALTFDEELGA